MQDILGELVRTRGVGGCLLLNHEGLVIESMLRSDVDAQALAAAVGELLAAIAELSRGMHLGRLASFSSFSEQGGIVLSAAGPAHLLVLCDASANPALLRLELRPFIDRIAERLSL
ncbi:MAG: roadblock/LC7 domain-containing protein [Planctomycetota bacterium]|nr:roadblock/LC7 domain-containing protein [Planctomycetota bacterium]MCX8039461.1 roadblock/LC7 domain-containing protein [Planctomycetota bacterium]MDW8373579.1 roadblock/LC7 domain-containing protein [Planctomycetota bacterium]